MDKLKSPAELREELSQEKRAVSPETVLIVDETIRGVHYKGTFQYRVPSIADQIMIGRMKAEYLPNGSAADLNAATLVECICYLEVTLHGQKPSWWKPMEFMEADLITKLYGEAVAYANTFLGRRENNGADASSDAIEDTGGDDFDPEGALEPEVQPANERSKVVLAHSSRAK